MIRFTHYAEDGTVSVAEWDDTEDTLTGDDWMIRAVEAAIADQVPCGCNYWGEIDPSLASDWEAYLTICGAVRAATGIEPYVYGVPDPPFPYEPEGVVDEGVVVPSE